MEKKKKYILILCSVGNRKNADFITEEILKQQLAAAINLIPMESRYFFDGEDKKSEEILMLIKTESDKFKAISCLIKKIHEYKIPSILKINTNGSKEYLKWISESLKRK